MRSIVVFSVAPLALSSLSEAPSWLPDDFRQWSAEYQKQYRTDDAWQRALRNFRANEAVIKELNSDEADGAEYGHTSFSDLTWSEFKEQYFPGSMDPESGRRDRSGKDMTFDFDAEVHAIPSSVDWRQQGAVTPVKDQSACGSCWAESAVSNMESIWYLANKETLKAPVPLSVEQVIECDEHDYACYGGFMKGAYEYVIESGGIASDADYPYDVMGHTICLANHTFNETCGDGMCDDPPLTSSCDLKCSDKAHKKVAKIHAWQALPKDEDAIASRLAEHGPISVGIDASGGALGILFPWLQFYKRGVANPKRCTTTIDHGVLLVGYGEDNGQKYWTVKNSWGAKWGEDGYFRLLRGGAKCGVDTMATTAVVNAREAVDAIFV